MFQKQGWHFAVLVLLLAGVYFLAQGDVLAGKFWGISTQTWLWIAVIVPVLHQIIVGLLWRAELYHRQLTRWFGDNNFRVYKALFTILFVARPISLICLGFANYGTITWHPILVYLLAGILFIPAAYSMYSVIRYFGINRAYGIDHFDPSYREKPFVRQGIYRYTDNAMYKFVFMILWVIALVVFSKAALLAAAFSHLYIWVHFYCTELPDIHYIYGQPATLVRKN